MVKLERERSPPGKSPARKRARTDLRVKEEPADEDEKTGNEEKTANEEQTDNKLPVKNAAPIAKAAKDKPKKKDKKTGNEKKHKDNEVEKAAKAKQTDNKLPFENAAPIAKAAKDKPKKKDEKTGNEKKQKDNEVENAAKAEQTDNKLPVKDAAPIAKAAEKRAKKQRVGAEYRIALPANEMMIDGEIGKKTAIYRIRQIIGLGKDLASSLFDSEMVPRKERITGRKDALFDRERTLVKRPDEYSVQFINTLYHLVSVHGPFICLEDFRQKVALHVDQRQRTGDPLSSVREVTAHDLRILLLDEVARRVEETAQPNATDRLVCADRVDDIFPLQAIKNCNKLKGNYTLPILFSELHDAERDARKILESKKFRFGLSELEKIQKPDTRYNQLKKVLYKSEGPYDKYLELRCRMTGHYQLMYEYFKHNFKRYDHQSPK
ncbi:hypothetical protein K490DRAFT_60819 [Saccharata proteae CBS 121410]|uniref:Uncharacterized protein n=1 Tax=Saccharata proteae CBS 121410 TaxID=1314787 RepID=A0A9P4LZR1_9PEZI|nr:hypothetical protein K490DRAFT_60819 [Saccharata proteae CBS 121410]